MSRGFSAIVTSLSSSAPRDKYHASTFYNSVYGYYIINNNNKIAINVIIFIVYNVEVGTYTLVYWKLSGRTRRRIIDNNEAVGSETEHKPADVELNEIARLFITQ